MAGQDPSPRTEDPPVRRTRRAMSSDHEPGGGRTLRGMRSLGPTAVSASSISRFFGLGGSSAGSAVASITLTGPRGFRDRFGEHPAGSEISAFHRIRLVIASPKGKHLQAGEGALRIRKVLSFAARDVSDRPQHDDGRDWEFYRQRGETKAATHGPRRRCQCLMQQARAPWLWRRRPP